MPHTIVWNWFFPHSFTSVLCPCTSYNQIAPFSVSICYYRFTRMFCIFSNFKFSYLHSGYSWAMCRGINDNSSDVGDNAMLEMRHQHLKRVAYINYRKYSSPTSMFSLTWKIARTFISENWFNLLLYFDSTDRALISAWSNSSFSVSQKYFFKTTGWLTKWLVSTRVERTATYRYNPGSVVLSFSGLTDRQTFWKIWIQIGQGQYPEAFSDIFLFVKPSEKFRRGNHSNSLIS